MTGVKPEIRGLVGNPNAVSAEQLAQWLTNDTVSLDDLLRVLPNEMVQEVTSYPSQTRHAISAPRPRAVAGTDHRIEKGDQDDCTEVYVWGLKGAGKSSVIGTILATQPESIAPLNDDERQRRGMELGKAYAENGGTIRLPEDAGAGMQSRIRLDIRKEEGRWHRRYPVMLIECAASHNRIDIEGSGVLSSKREQIHVLCWDCSYPANRMDEQEQALQDLLHGLHDQGVLHHTVGIYLLVTKEDTLLVPLHEYRKEVARQIIINEHPALWALVKNYCFDLDIRDAQPIPYSLGEVFLKELVRVDLSWARDFIEGPLLAKSQPARTLPERILMWGSLWSTVLLVLLLCVGIGYTATRSLSSITEPPTQGLPTFDFEGYYTHQVATRMGQQDFAKLRNNYLSLRSELKTEQMLRTNDGKPVLNPQEAKECRRVLANNYVPRLNQHIQKLFADSIWNNSVLSTMMASYRSDTDWESLTQDNRTQLQEDTLAIWQYNLAVRLAKSLRGRYYTSLYEIRDMSDEVANYRHWPLTNNKYLKENLFDAPRHAYESYASQLLRQLPSALNSRQAAQRLNDQMERTKQYLSAGSAMRGRLESAQRTIAQRYAQEPGFLERLGRAIGRLF